MFIVLINWRILPDQVEAFLSKWNTDLPLRGAKGLVGEFLSKVENSGFHQGVTWELEPDVVDDSSSWLHPEPLSYVNVGIWETADDFEAAVGQYMVAGRTLKEPFEAAPRRRAFVTPQYWRRGEVDLPSTTQGTIP